MARYKNVHWTIPDKLESWEQIMTAVLMDIRDELQTINRQLNCPRVPRALDAMVAFQKTAARLDKRVAKKISLKEQS